MFARLILALLLALTAMPGMAARPACHEGTGVAVGAMPGMPVHRDQPVTEHRCIGCMPLPESPAARVSFRVARAPLPRPLPTRLDLRAAGPPDAPPPRIG